MGEREGGQVMTTKEAIRLMRNLPTMCEFTDAYGEPIDSDAYYEALDMAINALQAQEWVPCKGRLPEEDHWLGGSGKQFSDEVLISITNREDEDAWSDISQTIDGEWRFELPRYCKITAWKPLPEPYREEDTDE